MPDFVLLGIQRDDGVMIIASDKVTEAELETQFDEIEYWTSPYERNLVPGARSITLTCFLRDYVVVYAPTYGEAFRNLFEQWTPKPQEHQALPEGQRGLPRGT